MNDRFLLVLGLLSLSGSALAQDCPAGIPSAGNPACIPPDRDNSPYHQEGYESVRSSAARVIWADRWGAIAFGRTSVVGAVTGMNSKRSAEKSALAECRKKTGKDCKIDLSYRNQCSAIAWGSSYASTAGAATIDEASADAVMACKKHTTDCQIYYTDCSLPERIR